MFEAALAKLSELKDEWDSFRARFLKEYPPTAEKRIQEAVATPIECQKNNIENMGAEVGRRFSIKSHSDSEVDYARESSFDHDEEITTLNEEVTLYSTTPERPRPFNARLVPLDTTIHSIFDVPPFCYSAAESDEDSGPDFCLQANEEPPVPYSDQQLVRDSTSSKEVCGKLTKKL